MIEIIDLHKSFKKLHVLKGVNLELHPGKVYSILGPNGCGKSTLIKSILGLVIPDKGNIVMNNVNIIGTYEYKNRIGYMPQKARYPVNVTVNEVLNMIKRVRSESVDFSDLINRFDIQEHLNKKVSNLSGGTLQKVSAIIALSYNTDIMILDEPTAGLDPASRIILKELIQDQASRGKTVLFSSHVLSDVEELSDEIIILMNGRSELKGSAQELKDLAKEITLEKALTKFYVEGAYAA